MLLKSLSFLLLACNALCAMEGDGADRRSAFKPVCRTGLCRSLTPSPTCRADSPEPGRRSASPKLRVHTNPQGKHYGALINVSDAVKVLEQLPTLEAARALVLINHCMSQEALVIIIQALSFEKVVEITPSLPDDIIRSVSKRFVWIDFPGVRYGPFPLGDYKNVELLAKFFTAKSFVGVLERHGAALFYVPSVQLGPLAPYMTPQMAQRVLLAAIHAVKIILDAQGAPAEKRARCKQHVLEVATVLRYSPDKIKALEDTFSS